MSADGVRSIPLADQAGQFGGLLCAWFGGIGAMTWYRDQKSAPDPVRDLWDPATDDERQTSGPSAFMLASGSMPASATTVTLDGCALP